MGMTEQPLVRLKYRITAANMWTWQIIRSYRNVYSKLLMLSFDFGYGRVTKAVITLQ